MELGRLTASFGTLHTRGWFTQKQFSLLYAKRKKVQAAVLQQQKRNPICCN